MTGRTLTLLGPDVLLVAMGGTGPNNAVLGVTCDGNLDGARVQRAVERLQPLVPFTASRLERPRPWGRLRWRAVAGNPPVQCRTLARSESIDDVIDEILNHRIDPREEAPLRWHVLTRPDGARSWLLLEWVHPLMDPRGAELLIAMVDAVDRGSDGEAWAAARCVVPPRDTRPWRLRLRLAQRALGRLREFGREPKHSVAGEVPADGRVRHRRRLVRAPARQLPTTVAAVGGAVADLLRARGVSMELPFVVPISVDRRRKGEPGPVIGNYVSFHFARFQPPAEDDLTATTATIRHDLVAAVRDDLVEGLWAGMNMARYYPPRHLLAPLGGRDVASFHCADTGAMRPSTGLLFGLPIQSVSHVPCVRPQPGLGVFFSRIGDVESIVAVWVAGVVAEEEVERLLDGVERALGATSVGASELEARDSV